MSRPAGSDGRGAAGQLLSQPDGGRTRQLVWRGLVALWLGVCDVFQPVWLLLRGARRAVLAGYAWWGRTPADGRRTALAAVVLGGVGVAALPYGLIALAGGAMSLAAWFGREQPERAALGAQDDWLRSIYSALVPHLGDGRDIRYRANSDYQSAFACWRFDDHDHLIALDAHVPDGFIRSATPAARAVAEDAVAAAAGCGSEYRFDWDDSAARLLVRVLPALPWGMPMTLASGPALPIGLTDGDPSGPNGPASLAWRARDSPALMVVAEPGAGASHLLRSLAIQALVAGEQLVVLDGRGHGGYQCLAGLSGSVQIAHTERERQAALAACAANAAGMPASEPGAGSGSAHGGPDASQNRSERRRWLIVDGLGDAADSLAPLLANQSATGWTVVVAERPGMAPAWLTSLFPARVALGPISRQAAVDVFGAPLGVVGGERLPPGRGYARLGAGPVVRLQAPYAPDPLAGDTPNAAREWISRLVQDATLLSPDPPLTPLRP